MNIAETVILGLIQGLTEFIPISSSGHLVIAQYFFGQGSDHLFLEFINIGTMLALLVYFRRRIWQILVDIFEHKNSTLARNILITAIPAGAIGYLLSDFIASSAFFGSLIVVACTLFVVGLMMVLLEKMPKLSAQKDGSTLSAWRALTVGLVQILALIPGVSRSGSTIIAGRLVGLDAKNAAEYSFLASLPIMVGVTIKTLFGDTEYLMSHLWPLVVGNVVAFVSGLFAVGFLMRYLSKHGLAVFGWYRIGLAVLLAAILLVQG